MLKYHVFTWTTEKINLIIIYFSFDFIKKIWETKIITKIHGKYLLFLHNEAQNLSSIAQTRTCAWFLFCYNKSKKKTQNKFWSENQFLEKMDGTEENAQCEGQVFSCKRCKPWINLSFLSLSLYITLLHNILPILWGDIGLGERILLHCKEGLYGTSFEINIK